MEVMRIIRYNRPALINVNSTTRTPMKPIIPTYIIIGLSIFLFFFLLAPYLKLSVIGNTGLLSVFFFFLFNYKKVKSALKKKVVIYVFLIAITISIYSFLLSLLFNGDGPLYVLKILLSGFLYIIVGIVLYDHLYLKRGLSINDSVLLIFKISLNVILVNSLVIIVTQFNPAIKSFIEGLLQNVSNIDYGAHEWRARGIASAGGASLSIFHSIGVIIAVCLTLNKHIGYFNLVLSLTIIFISIIFIGRSGLIFAVLGVILSILYNLNRISIPKFLAIVTFIFLVGYGLAAILVDNVSASVLEYTLFNTFNYSELRNDEGLNIFLNQHFRIPTDPFALLFGVGSFESRNDFQLYSDSGYMRLLYYFGIPGAAVVLTAIVNFLLYPAKYEHISKIYLPIFVVLLIANIKEPVLYTGYSARIIFLLAGFLMAARLQFGLGRRLEKDLN